MVTPSTNNYHGRPTQDNRTENMNDSTHYSERKEDLQDRREVASIHKIDFSIIKWMGGVLTAILAFLAVQVYNDHTSLAAIGQWQTDYGSKIDSMTAALNTLESKTNYVPITVPRALNMAKATSTALEI